MNTLLQQNNIVDIKISNRHARALVDTGASLSVICQRYLRKLPHIPIDPNPKALKFAFTASGEKIHFVGTAQIPVNVNGLILPSTFYVAPTLSSAFDTILGLDFLTKFKCRIDIPLGVVTFADETTVLHLRGQHRRTHNDGVAVISHAVTLPPSSESVIVLRTRNCVLQECLMLQPIDYIQARLNTAVARSIAAPRNGTVPCRILNPLIKPLHIRKNTILATLHSTQNCRIISFGHPDSSRNEKRQGNERHAKIFSISPDSDKFKSNT